MGVEVQVLLRSADADLGVRVRQMLAEAGIPGFAVCDDDAACMSAAEKGGQTVICLDAADCPEGLAGLITRITQRAVMPVVVLLRRPDFDLARRVSRAGATDVLLIPGELPGLAESVRRALIRARSAAGEAGRPPGRLVALYSAKGGSGRTLLAANLALALQDKRRVLLIDLDLQTGGAETALGLKAERSLLDLLPVLDELNETHLRNVVTAHPSGLDLLAAPAAGAVVDQLAPPQIGPLLTTCRRYYDMVVFDLPAWRNPGTQAVLSSADQILYIITPDAMSIAVLQRTLPVLRSVRSAEHLSLVVNRKSSGNELKSQDIARLVDLPVIGEIRAAYREIEPLLNLGKPLIGRRTVRQSGLVREIRALAAQLA